MKNKVIIFGASYDGRRIFRYLNKKNKATIFLDNDIKKHNKRFLGTRIFHPEKINKNYIGKIIYLGGRYMDEQYNQLLNLNKFNKCKIIKTNRWIYKPSIKEIKFKENYLLELIKYTFKILGPYEKKLIADTSTLLGILRKQDLANFSDLDFSIDQKEINKVYRKLLEKNKKYKIQVKKQKKNFLGFKKGEISQIIISEKCNLKLREPNVLDICAEKKRGNFFIKYDGTNFYSKVPLKYRIKFIKLKYKNINFIAPQPLNNYIKFCYGKNWKKKAKKWKPTMSKRFVKIGK